MRLTDADIARLAAFLAAAEAAFIAQYTTLAHDRRGLVLQEQPGGACIFLQGSDCRVNAAKPRQCAEFPRTWNNPGWDRLCMAARRSAQAAGPGALDNSAQSCFFPASEAGTNS